MAKSKSKVFVLDTNVILHDSSCIRQFKDNDVVIPISVIEELDRFKKGNDSVNFHAREFARALDALDAEGLLNGGLSIGPDMGRITVRLDVEFPRDVLFSFTRDNPDHRILSTAYSYSKEFPDRAVILVTKDVNLRLKAKSLGLASEDYTTDHVSPDDSCATGIRRIDDVPEDVVNAIYTEPYEVPADFLMADLDLHANEFLILRNGKKSALSVYDHKTNRVRRVDKAQAYGITPRNAEQTFALHALMDPMIKLVTITGRAGTGKTLLALAAALEMRREYRQIYMARPVVPLSNKDIGFLPGDISSKLDPYMQPLHDNLGVIQNQFAENSPMHSKISELVETQKLKIAPLAYIRGRSIVKVFFIVDESQNLTPHEVKTIITRAGEDTKIVLTGDVYQIDHPYIDTQSNGLSYLIERMRGQGIHAHVNLEKGERSELADLASNLL